MVEEHEGEGYTVVVVSSRITIAHLCWSFPPVQMRLIIAAIVLVILGVIIAIVVVMSGGAK